MGITQTISVNLKSQSSVASFQNEAVKYENKRLLEVDEETITINKDNTTLDQ